MDKSLEVIMVAVMLVIAVVVLVSMLQDSSSDVGDFQSDASQTAFCDVSNQRYKTALECDGSLIKQNQKSGPVTILERANDRGCAWATPEDHKEIARGICN
jgi:hypothetical protein